MQITSKKNFRVKFYNRNKKEKNNRISLKYIDIYFSFTYQALGKKAF